jgi:hypothetical protein
MRFPRTTPNTNPITSLSSPNTAGGTNHSSIQTSNNNNNNNHHLPFRIDSPPARTPSAQDNSNTNKESTTTTTTTAATTTTTTNTTTNTKPNHHHLNPPKFVLKPALGDGNCLFRSVSLQVFGDEEWHDRVREQAIDWISKNKDHFEDFVSGDFNRYVEQKKHLGTYGDNPEIQAIAELYNRPVIVVDGDETITVDNTTTSTSRPIMNEKNIMEVEFPQGEKRLLRTLNIFHGKYEDAMPIRVCYRGKGHYDAIIDEHNATIGVGLGLPSYDPGAADRELLVGATKESETTAQVQEEKLALEVSLATDVEATEREWEKAAIAASLQDVTMWNSQNIYGMDSSGTSAGGSASSTSNNNTASSNSNTSMMFGNYYNNKKRPYYTSSMGGSGSGTTSAASSAASSNHHSLSSSSPASTSNYSTFGLGTNTNNNNIGGNVYQPSSGGASHTSKRRKFSNNSSGMMMMGSTTITNNSADASSSTSINPMNHSSTSSTTTNNNNNDDSLPSIEAFAPSIRELVMNGFPLQSVLLANQAVGDNFDDMLSVLLAEGVL